eukprot:COSAG01_NODE_37975_length_496_cov_0.909320_1_plen_112_part_10
MVRQQTRSQKATPAHTGVAPAVLGLKRSLDADTVGGSYGGMSCLSFMSVAHRDRDMTADSGPVWTQCGAVSVPEDSTGTTFSMVERPGAAISLDDDVQWSFLGDEVHCTSEG